MRTGWGALPLALAVSAVLLLVFSIAEPGYPSGRLFVVLYTLGVLSFLVSGGMLSMRARVLRSGRLSWLAATYLTLALTMVMRTGSDDIEVGADGLRVPTTGSAGVSVLSALALAGGMALASRATKYVISLRIGAAAVVLAAVAVLPVVDDSLPDTYASDGSSTALGLGLWVLALVCLATATWVVWRQVGPQVAVDWTLRWPLVALAFALCATGLRVVSLQVHDAAWWSASVMQALTGLVLMTGLVAGAASLLHRLEGFTERFAEDLETEVRRASTPGSLLLEDDFEDRTEDARALARASSSIRALEDLLQDRELNVVLQAVVDLRRGEVTGVEALSRISGPQATPPSEFFADAAAAGVSREAELLAVQRALELLPELPGRTWLALNVSPGTAASPELAELFRPHDRSRLVLELTEHAEVERYDALIDALSRLRETGVRIAVDDAGAGFASFRHVVRLRPEIVKLDMSLIAGIDTDPVRRALVSSLLSFSRSIGSVVIAEGIETRGELEVLTSLGVRLGQGYLLGRPRPAAEALVVTLPDTTAARRAAMAR